MDHPRRHGRPGAFRSVVLCAELGRVAGLPGCSLRPADVGRGAWTYRRHTGRETAPTSPAREAWVIAGRRGGKSRIAALVGCYLAAFRDWRSVLAPGETGVVMLLASDRRQARVLLKYVRAFLDSSPMLRRLVASDGKETIELTNGITIEVVTAHFARVRGFSIVAAVLDEVAFWEPSDDAANPDRAGRRGAAAGYGDDGRALTRHQQPSRPPWRALRPVPPPLRAGRRAVLVWRAETLAMNPTIRRQVIDEAMELDPAAARSEWLGEWRNDTEAFVTAEAIDAVTVPGRKRLPPVAGVHYAAFTDAASGGGKDSWTLGIAHAEENRAVLDVAFERRPPFSPEAVVLELARIAREYQVTTIVGDATRPASSARRSPGLDAAMSRARGRGRSVTWSCCH